MKTLFGVVAALVLASPAANAVEIRFYTVDRNTYGGIHDPAAADSATYVTPTTVVSPTSAGCGLYDECGASLIYTGTPLGGVDLTATSSNATNTIQDVTPTDGGIGANGGTAADNIGVGEWVKIVFSAPVTITGIFSYSDHSLTDAGAQFRINNTTYSFNGNQWVNVAHSGTEFFIRYGNARGENGDTFYLSALRYDVVVPEPATLALLGLGLAGIGFGARRRKA